MAVENLPETVQALYAELLDESIAAAASVAASGMTSGSFVSKKIKGHTYWYLQRSEGERVRQIYLGPESNALNGWMERLRVITDS